jgi:hypothetical protein
MFISRMVESILPSDGNIAPGLFFRPTNSAIYFSGYSFVVKEITYTAVIKRGELILTVSFPMLSLDQGVITR